MLGSATNWAFERSFIGAIKTAPSADVIVIENARLDRRDQFIASAFFERFITDPVPFLFSTGTGSPALIVNNEVIGLSTNFSLVSTDILNRGLPIHPNEIEAELRCRRHRTAPACLTKLGHPLANVAALCEILPQPCGIGVAVGQRDVAVWPDEIKRAGQ